MYRGCLLKGRLVFGEPCVVHEVHARLRVGAARPLLLFALLVDLGIALLDEQRRGIVVSFVDTGGLRLCCTYPQRRGGNAASSLVGISSSVGYIHAGVGGGG